MPLPASIHCAQPNGKTADRIRQKAKRSTLRTVEDEPASRIYRGIGKGRSTHTDFDTVADNLARIMKTGCGIAPAATAEGAR